MALVGCVRPERVYLTQGKEGKKTKAAIGVKDKFLFRNHLQQLGVNSAVNTVTEATIKPMTSLPHLRRLSPFKPDNVSTSNQFWFLKVTAQQ